MHGRNHIRAAARFVFASLFLCMAANVYAQTPAPLPEKFTLKKSGLELERRTQSGSFFDVVGRRSALFGYENRAMEAWVYPLKILDDFQLSFNLEGYPLDIHGPDIMVAINARPEATIFTYSHAAFTVRQIVYAPVDEPGLIMLLDIDSVLPMTITGSFRPKLRLMWPAGFETGYVGFDESAHAYFLGEESRRFAAWVGSPGAREVSLQPYQEEPRDLPVRFVIETSPAEMRSRFIPIVIGASTEGRDKARAAYDKLLANAQSLYDRNVDYYARLTNDTTSIGTPDQRLNTAFAWAKVGVDKGVATNPMMGTGLIAGFRTSGESERPGFAWFFGRDSMWTTLAINSYGDFAVTRTALDFLKQFQRADGKIPHEISQSAPLIRWFTDYSYPWASADATPLYIIGHADYWRASGDTDFIRKNWDSIVNAYRFTAKTDTDGNGLVENTGVGHGWVEGGALYPPHEEIYMQGVWMEALNGLAEMAEALGDRLIPAEARAAIERTRKATEQTYWLQSQGYYAFATHRPKTTPNQAEPGPRRDRRQQRLNELAKVTLIDEDTVLPAVPLWWQTLDAARADAEIDHLGSGQMATDWGARIISNRSRLYDPLSYHYGSVWPLFTGWAAVGAYRYGRSSVGYQALMANALLTYANALGYVTELLSGDYQSAFGRSSHHQVWSEAMVISPTIRGLFGLEARDGGRTLRFAPQIPADWNGAVVRNFAAGPARYDLSIEQVAGVATARINQRNASANARGVSRMVIAPAFPLDAQIKSATVNGRAAKFEVRRAGDVQFAEVTFDNPTASTEVVIAYTEGTRVYAEPQPLIAGAMNQGLRILRSRADATALHLTVEGLGGRSYTATVRSPKQVGAAEGVTFNLSKAGEPQLTIRFDGPANEYVRRELALPLTARR
ncbi:MAG TPA: GH116 family glycosyl hydrolase [Blastocatellia bacterium]|nr:GH116 family glycosyl hydrolase [Blastocatellia bacterium]